MNPTDLPAVVTEIVKNIVGRELRDFCRVELAKMAAPMSDKAAFTTPEISAITGLRRTSIFHLARKGTFIRAAQRNQHRETLWTRESVEAFLNKRGQSLRNTTLEALRADVASLKADVAALKGAR